MSAFTKTAPSLWGRFTPDGPLSIAEATRLRDALGAAIAAATAATN
ncbi:hypothetical protein [Mycobacterium paragordonae]|nr:hypothetical protein [Mycobacterium paragordonae]